MRCRNWGFVAKNEASPDEHKLSRIRCKQWDCDYCSKRLQAQWRNHLQKEISRLGGAWSMMTITAGGDAHRNKATLTDLRGAMDALQKRLRRGWRKFEYVRFYEQHASGEYHAHVLISLYPAEKDMARTAHVWNRARGEYEERYRGDYWYDLVAHATDLNLGYICDFLPIGTVADDGFALIVSYVTKYLTKQRQNYEASKGLRRIQASRGFNPLNVHEDADSAWFVDAGGYTLEQFLMRDNAGIAIHDLDKRKLVKLSDYEDYKVLSYPSHVHDDTK